MDISREKSADTDNGASIRLRYSRQFQSGGHAHTIDAEIALPIGANQEVREQVIRELEMGVEQLARQVVQHTTRTTENPRVQTPAPLQQSSSASTASRPPLSAHTQTEPAGQMAQRSASGSALPPSRAPIGESMPSTPGARGEGKKIGLADFLTAIRKHLNISADEARQLLGVDSLDGLNFKEAFATLQRIIKQRNAEGTDARNRTPTPINEAQRQPGKASPSPMTRPPLNQIQTQGARQQDHSAHQTVAHNTSPIDEPVSKAESEVDFAGSPKAPIPIQFGVVRDNSVRAYKFEEEEDEDENFEEEEEEEDEEVPGAQVYGHTGAQAKLDGLKEIRGSAAPGAERLIALNNVIDSQISEAQLQRIMQNIWSISTRKKLKALQVEALISWAKEDYFAEEVDEMLALFDKGEE